MTYVCFTDLALINCIAASRLSTTTIGNNGPNICKYNRICICNYIYLFHNYRYNNHNYNRKVFMDLHVWNAHICIVKQSSYGTLVCKAM